MWSVRVRPSLDARFALARVRTERSRRRRRRSFSAGGNVPSPPAAATPGPKGAMVMESPRFLSEIFPEEHADLSWVPDGRYMPPEYINSGVISKKFDVFSLGVIILKIMAGNKGYSSCYDLPPKQFAELVIDNWKERLQSTSGHSSEEIDILRAEACVNIALRCVARDRHRRPSVKDIVNELEELESTKQLPVRSYQGPFGGNYRMENKHMEFDSLESILGGSESPRHPKLPFLQFTTNNFSDELKIGSGGCGVVYKGILQNQIIAVKRLLNSHTIYDKMFHREVKSLMMVNHKNVVQFLGYCSNTEEQALKMEGKLIMAQDRERLLCFEYLINGSLESYLTDELRGLQWQTRYQIIKGICDGLHHLHNENHIIHMDLKPANILLDSNMVPKITDFGLSRLDNISQTMSSERLVSLLGVIILELVTGSKEDPNLTKVHRRWKHRWNKTAKDAQLGYKQVATCLHLAGRCMQIDPTDRPNIWDIVSCLNQMDSSDAETSDGTECMELEDMLGVEPLEIHLPLELNKQISCSIQLTNDTDDHFAFRILTTSLRPYCVEANEDIVPPRSKCIVTISLQALDKALLDHQCMDEFSVQSTRIDGCLAATNIGGDIFNEEPGKVIDTVNFSVVLNEASSPSGDH